MKISWEKTKEEKGVLVAFDSSLQPFIVWWYTALRKFCSLPIAFISLGGISKSVKDWCKSRGYYYDLEDYVSYFKKIKLSEYKIKKWSNSINGNVLPFRPFWFTKPIAMMHTPFAKTLYLDIDCEVKQNIEEIFLCLEKNEMGLCKDVSEFFENIKEELKVIYNSGVIIYKTKSKIIEQWAKLSFRSYDKNFLGDQDLLSHIIFECNYQPEVLPLFWNWHEILNDNNLVKILHWAGASKIKILEKIKNDLI